MVVPKILLKKLLVGYATWTESAEHSRGGASLWPAGGAPLAQETLSWTGRRPRPGRVPLWLSTCWPWGKGYRVCQKGCRKGQVCPHKFLRIFPDPSRCFDLVAGMRASRRWRRWAPQAQTSGRCALGLRRSWRLWEPWSDRERRSRRRCAPVRVGRKAWRGGDRVPPPRPDASRLPQAPAQRRNSYDSCPA